MKKETFMRRKNFAIEDYVNPEDLVYLKDLSEDDEIFIRNGIGSNINIQERVELFVSLGKLMEVWEDDTKVDSYGTAIKGARRVALSSDLDIFRQYVQVATDPRKFDGDYPTYCDSLQEVLDSPKARARGKVKIMK